MEPTADILAFRPSVSDCARLDLKRLQFAFYSIQSVSYLMQLRTLGFRLQ